MSKRLLRFAVAALTLILCFAAQSALGLTLTWNNNAGDFQWNTTSLNWSNGANTTWATGNDAVFGSTGVGTVTLAAPIAANSLTFNAAGYAIAGGGNTLTSGSGGITANASAAISSNISLSANQTWQAATGTTLTESGNISGAYGITFGSIAINVDLLILP